MSKLRLYTASCTSRLLSAAGMKDARKLLIEEYGDTTDVRNAVIRLATGPIMVQYNGDDSKSSVRRMTVKQCEEIWCNERQIVPQA